MSGLFQSEWFYVSNNRWGMYFSQVLPLIGVRLDLGPVLVMQLMSLNYVLVHLTIIFLCLFVFRDFKAALLIFFLLFFSGVYMHFIKEYALWNGLVYCIFLSSFLDQVYKKGNVLHLILIAGISVLILYTLTLCIFFLLTLLLLHQDKFSKKAMAFLVFVIACTLFRSITASLYLYRNFAQVVGGGFNMSGIRVVVLSAGNYLFYFASICTILTAAYYFTRKRLDTAMKKVWAVHILFFAVAIRYLIAVFGRDIGFDDPQLSMVRFEATFLLPLASLTYFMLRMLHWDSRTMAFLIFLSLLRYALINAGAVPLHRQISDRETLIRYLSVEFPDNSVFIASRSCSFLPPYLETDDFKQESALIGMYTRTDIIIYLTNHPVRYHQDGRPVFVNKSPYAVNPSGRVDLEDETTYFLKFDPVREFPSMNIQDEDIRVLTCDLP